MTRLTTMLMLSGLMALTPVCVAEDASDEHTKLFDALDQDGDGTLNGEEIADAQRSAFERLLRVSDADGDGELTKAEYLAGLRPDEPVDLDQRGGRGPFVQRGRQPLLDAERFFQMADRDEDGKVRLEDVPEPMRPRIKPLFERLDTDEITREDFERLRRRQGGRPPGTAGARPPMALLRVLDADGDGLLSKSELAQITDKFSELDRNGDGQLAPGELLGFAGGMMAGRDGRRPSSAPRSNRPQRPEESSEAAQPRAESGERPPQRRGAGQLLRQYDADGDGALSREEAPERLAERFDRMDANGDGKMTADEFERIFSGRRRNPPKD